MSQLKVLLKGIINLTCSSCELFTLIVQDTSQCANFPERASPSEAEGCLAAKERRM